MPAKPMVNFFPETTVIFRTTTPVVPAGTVTLSVGAALFAPTGGVWVSVMVFLVRLLCYGLRRLIRAGQKFGLSQR